MEDKRIPWLIGLQLVLLTLIAVNLLMTAGLVRRPEPERLNPSLPVAHESVPWAFVTEYPECADHLLHTMNITNVHVQRFNGTLPGDEIENDPVVVAERAAHPASERNQSTPSPGTGARLTELPMSPERIALALVNGKH